MLVFIATADDESARNELAQAVAKRLVPLCPQLADAAERVLWVEHEALAWAHVAVLGAPLEASDDPEGRLARLRSHAEALGVPVVATVAALQPHPVELDNPEQSALFRQTLGTIYRTYLAKNRDYSSANILGVGELGLVTRLWDKMARLLNLTGLRMSAHFRGYVPPTSPANEAVDDTYLDLATYGVIGRIVRAGKWGR